MARRPARTLRPRLARRLGRAWSHGVKVLQRSIAEFFDDRAIQHAAAISYYALLGLFPLAILVVLGFGLVVSEDVVRDRVLEFLDEQLPLARGEDRAQLRDALEAVTDNPGTVGLIGLGGLVLSASGFMGAVRSALNAAWDAEETRPPLQGKLLDVLLVSLAGLVGAVSLALTLANRLVASAAEEGEVGSIVLQLGQLIPLVVSFLLFAFLYRVVPATGTTLRDVWPGALVAAAGYELAKTGFSVYLENFSNYSAVYGSLGTVIAFLVFVFVAAILFLLGAEVASEWPRVRAGQHDDGDGDGEPLGRRVRGFLRSLVVSKDAR